jgi:hypothetical protein
MADDNIYKAPDAELQVDNSEVDEFYPVSMKKFWIMHLLTFGAYDFYWFYRHWDHYKTRRVLELSPAIRGVFFFLFVYPTFNTIRKSAEEKQLGDLPGLRMLALLYYALLIVSLGISFSFRQAFLLNPWWSLVTNLIGNIVTGLIFSKVQGVANRVNDDPAGGKNSRITALNIVWIVVLLVLNLLSVLSRAAQQQ